MRKLTKITSVLLLCLMLLPVNAFGRELVAVGQVVGLELRDGSVTVAAFDETLGAAAQRAGMEIGDCIVSINGRTIHNAEDVRKALESSKGTVEVLLMRQDQKIVCKLQPQITTDGPKLGIFLKQGVTGVGTVTWYDPESGRFGTLGHGVNNASGQLLQLKQGSAFETRIMAVRKGKNGEPGQLMGCAQNRTPIGSLQANLPQGVFGITETGWVGRMVEVAQWEQIRTGKATILSTVSGDTVREYSVEILKIYPKAGVSGRNLLIKVTDPALLEATGGIVQGMSGSPILQNGKLIGAVTHVLVNDPTTGYGIFIENMLSAVGA